MFVIWSEPVAIIKALMQKYWVVIYCYVLWGTLTGYRMLDNTLQIVKARTHVVFCRAVSHLKCTIWTKPTAITHCGIVTKNGVSKPGIVTCDRDVLALLRELLSNFWCRRCPNHVFILDTTLGPYIDWSNITARRDEKQWSFEIWYAIY